MPGRFFAFSRPSCYWMLAGGMLVSLTTGCAGGAGSLSFFGSPFPTVPGTGGGTGGPSTTGNVPGTGGLGGSNRNPVDPCTESESRKFIRLSLRNLAPDDTIHYFLLLFAQINSDTYPNGAVCPDDIDVYLAADYIEIAEGELVTIGNICFIGPGLYYFHEAGQFQNAGGAGGTRLASAIGPAQGTTATFDAFFTSAGARMPIPNQIYFHNPGTGEGAALKISRNSSGPCDVLAVAGEAECRQDAFYYVGDDDVMAGSTALGAGSGRRVPNEIQGTGCECLGTNPFWELAPSGVTATGARCNEYLRGGRIEVAFLREDTNPPFPQAVWRVTDGTGSIVHQFDSRAGVP